METPETPTPTMGIRIMRRMVDGEIITEDVPDVTRIEFVTPSGQPICVVPNTDYIEIRHAEGQPLDGRFPTGTHTPIEKGTPDAAENADAGEHS